LLDRSGNALGCFPAAIHGSQCGCVFAEPRKRSLEALTQRNHSFALHQFVGRVHDDRFIQLPSASCCAAPASLTHR
jgi:hypothetical protein